jgi:hypothetical protein
MNVEGFKYIAIANNTHILILSEELIETANVADFRT